MLTTQTDLMHNLEVTALISQIDLIADNTKFNGIALLSGGFSLDVHAGATTGERVRVGIGSVTVSGIAMTGGACHGQHPSPHH